MDPLLFSLGLIGFVWGAFIGHCGKEALACEKFICLLYGENLREEPKGKANTDKYCAVCYKQGIFSVLYVYAEVQENIGQEDTKQPIRVEAIPRK